MLWKTPAQQMAIRKGVDRVELLSLPSRKILSEVGWPETFWPHVGDRHLLVGRESERAIRLFQELEPGDPARCHTPPWGLAFYEHQTLLFTVTLCYRCSNAYVYTNRGRELTAFDPDGPCAIDLREILTAHLPLSE